MCTPEFVKQLTHNLKGIREVGIAELIKALGLTPETQEADKAFINICSNLVTLDGHQKATSYSLSGKALAAARALNAATTYCGSNYSNQLPWVIKSYTDIYGEN